MWREASAFKSARAASGVRHSLHLLLTSINNSKTKITKINLKHNQGKENE